MTLSTVSQTMTNLPLTSEAKLESLSTLSLRHLVPAHDERAIFVGRTGSGKTLLAQYLSYYMPFVVVLDVKGRIMWPGYERFTRLTDAAKSSHSHIVYAPSWDELKYDPRRERWSPYIEEFFRWAYARGNTVVYVDEVMGVTRGDEMPEYYRAAVTRGRELNVSVWSATQRPTRIPQVLLSEAEHFYVFNLQLGQDIAKMEEIAGVEFPPRKHHEFAYVRIGDDEAQKFILSVPDIRQEG